MVYEQDKLLQMEIICRAADRRLLGDFCKGFDLVKKSCFVIGDTVSLHFITEGRFCMYNGKGIR